MEYDLLLEAKRENYGLSQIEHTMTVSELIEYLERYDGDQKVYISNDNGYTYGAITEHNFREEETDI